MRAASATSSKARWVAVGVTALVRDRAGDQAAQGRVDPLVPGEEFRREAGLAATSARAGPAASDRRRSVAMPAPSLRS